MSQDEATSSGEETKLVALSVIELCLAELVSYQKNGIFKTSQQLVERLRVNLKTFWA